MQTIYRELHRKVTKLKSKFYLFLGKLNQALNNLAQELHFGAGLNLYIMTYRTVNVALSYPVLGSQSYSSTGFGSSCPLVEQTMILK